MTQQIVNARRILVIDDAPVVRLYYRKILEADGFEVQEAENGLEGLEIAVCNHFDLCIVDLNMPVMDGYRFLHALRREQSTQALPALMISVEDGAQDYQEALRAGANAYLVKPVPRAQLSQYAALLLGRAA